MNKFKIGKTYKPTKRLIYSEPEWYLQKPSGFRKYFATFQETLNYWITYGQYLY